MLKLQPLYISGIHIALYSKVTITTTHIKNISCEKVRNKREVNGKFVRRKREKKEQFFRYNNLQNIDKQQFITHPASHKKILETLRLLAHTYTFVLLAILLLCGHPALAQEFPLCTTKYFTGTKKVSTTHCYDKDNRWGRARAFNRLGQQIYERDLRRIAGHSTVEFTYYESGAVKTASYSSAPDAGIQWYRSHTTFSEDGKVTSETHDDYDNRPQVFYRTRPGEHIPDKPVVVTPAPHKTTVAECAVIYSSEFWFTNYTPHTVIITATGKYNKSVTFTLSLHPRETLKCGQLILAQQFDDPAKTFDFTVTPLKPGKKQKLIIIPSEDRLPENTSKETRRYYYEVRRII
jgi:hypothetical protein